LQSLDSITDILNAIQIHNVLLKLDSDARQAYNRSHACDTLPSWDHCYKTLTRHSEFLDCSATCILTERLSEKRHEKQYGNRHDNLLNLHRFTQVSKQVITASPMDDTSQVDPCTQAVSLLAKQSRRALIPTMLSSRLGIGDQLYHRGTGKAVSAYRCSAAV